MPPAASAGKSLSRSSPWSSAAITSVAVATPGITSTSSSRHRSTTAQAEAGRDDEPRARRDRLVDLLRPHDRARADESVGLGGDAPDRLGGDRRAERDLGDRQAALGEGRGDRHRSLELVEHDDRDDPTAQKRMQDVVLSHLLPRNGLDQRGRPRRGSARHSAGGGASVDRRRVVRIAARARKPIPRATAARQPCPSITAPPTTVPAAIPIDDGRAEPRERLCDRAGRGNAADLAVERRDDRSDRETGAEHQQRHRPDRRGEERQRHQPGEDERADDDAPALVPRGPQARPASPPTSEPAEKPASAIPASARLPCVSAKAGTAISTAPKPRPSQMQRSAIVRTPIAESAPSRELCRSSAGTASRTGGMREKTNVPTAARTAAPTTGATGIDDREHGDEERAADEDHLLQRGVERVRGARAVLSRNGRPDRAEHRRDGRQRQPGAAAATTAIAAAARRPLRGARRDRRAIGKSIMRRRSTSLAPRRSTCRPPYGAPIATAIP